MLYTILYISNADRAFSSQELDELVWESRAWNSLHGITGFLAYVEGVLDGKTKCQFIQVLEGKKRDIEDVFNVIKQDPRHQDICVLKEGYIKERKFDSWDMGFERLHLNSNPELELFFSMNLSMLSEEGDLEDNILIQFMKTSYDQNEQINRNLKQADNPRPYIIAFQPDVRRFCNN
jgi:hypothetical protein